MLSRLMVIFIYLVVYNDNYMFWKQSTEQIHFPAVLSYLTKHLLHCSYYNEEESLILLQSFAVKCTAKYQYHFSSLRKSAEIHDINASCET